jgi:hypothetical protein
MDVSALMIRSLVLQPRKRGIPVTDEFLHYSAGRYSECEQT